jgi:hypothetical protein
MEKYNYLNFLQSKESFDAFLTDARVTEEEKHKILIKSRADILKQAKRLNKLMNNKNISTEQRVVYVSGMLLSMQDIKDKDGNLIAEGLKTADCKSPSCKGSGRPPKATTRAELASVKARYKPLLTCALACKAMIDSTKVHIT